LKNLGFPVFQKLWRKAFNPDLMPLGIIAFRLGGDKK
jgi:hypothetical protein